MTDSLAIYNQFNQLQQAASTLYKSGYFTDAKSEAQAIVKVMAGSELGLPPFASMAGIHIIQGKPVMGANLLATLIKNDPRYNYRVTKLDDQECSIDFYECGEKIGNSTFTAADAKKAGSKNLDRFPRNMLFARAISNGAKWYTPGIFGGAPVYTPDEFGMDVDDDGDPVITVEARDATPEPADYYDLNKDTGMSLQFAENEMSSNGERYGDIDSDKLHYMTIGIKKGLAKPELTPDMAEEYNRKLSAIQTILAHRGA